MIAVDLPLGGDRKLFGLSWVEPPSLKIGTPLLYLRLDTGNRLFVERTALRTEIQEPNESLETRQE